MNTTNRKPRLIQGNISSSETARIVEDNERRRQIIRERNYRKRMQEMILDDLDLGDVMVEEDNELLEAWNEHEEQYLNSIADE